MSPLDFHLDRSISVVVVPVGGGRVGADRCDHGDWRRWIGVQWVSGRLIRLLHRRGRGRGGPRGLWLVGGGKLWGTICFGAVGVVGGCSLCVF